MAGARSTLQWWCWLMSGGRPQNLLPSVLTDDEERELQRLDKARRTRWSRWYRIRGGMST